MTSARQEIGREQAKKGPPALSTGNTAGNIRNNPLGKARIARPGVRQARGIRSRGIRAA